VKARERAGALNREPDKGLQPLANKIGTKVNMDVKVLLSLGHQRAMRPIMAVALAVVFAATGAASGPARAAEEPKEAGSEAETGAVQEKTAKTAKAGWVHGSFEADFDGTWADGRSDVDLGQALRLKVDPPGHERIRVRASLWLHEDLDANESARGVLRDINDASHADVRARLLYLYADFDDLWGDSTLRLGRQRIVEGVAYNRIDGAYFKQRRARWDWYAFGGVRASVYEDGHKDPVVGGGAGVSLSHRTRLALDTYWGEGDGVVRDARSVWFLGRLLPLPFSWREERELTDASVALSAWHDVTPNLRLFGRFTWRDGEGDELVLDATGYVPALDVTCQLVYRRQLGTLGDRVSDVAYLGGVLGAYEQYDHLLLALHRPFGERVELSLEAETHDAHHDDWTTANRDYFRAAAIASVTDVVGGVDARLALERWDVDGGEGTWAVTGELVRAWPSVTLTLGADYERYEDRIAYYSPLAYSLDQLFVALLPGVYAGYNPAVAILDEWVVERRENVYSLYAKAKWAVCERQDVTVGVTYEEDDGSESPYWRMQAAYAIRF